MGRVITGLDRVRLNCLVELVVGDAEIALGPRILTGLTAVRATLMHLRSNASQVGIADIMGASQPMISRTMTVITRIIARVLGPVSDTVEEAPRGGLRIIDGMPLPCWSWKDPPGLFSGKHKCIGATCKSWWV